MTRAPVLFKRRFQRGFSIVELMVAVVIGMLALLFATKMVTGSQQGNRTALSGSDAMQNGMLALFSMGNDAAQAGYGLNDPILAGCDTVMSDTQNYQLVTTTVGGVVTRPLAAVVIQNNGLGSDAVSMYSGSSLAGTATVRLLLNYTGGTALSIDRPPAGFNNKDVIVVAPEQAGGKCAMAQLSAQPDLGAATPTLTFDTGADIDHRFNSGALGQSFTGSAARAFDLGPGANLSFHTWTVSDGFLKLRATNPSGTSALAKSVADNIVSIKAMYGFDTRAGTAFTPELGTTVTKWSADMIDADGDGVTGGAGDYQRVVAVRLAVIARGKNVERLAPGATTCTTTPTAPVVFNTTQVGGSTSIAITPTVAVAGDPIDWQCYSYRVFENIVPIRNAAWRPTAWTK